MKCISNLFLQHERPRRVYDDEIRDIEQKKARIWRIKIVAHI